MSFTFNALDFQEVNKIFKGFELDQRKKQLDEKDAARRAQLKETHDEEQKGINLDALVNTAATVATAFSSTVGHIQTIKLAADLLSNSSNGKTSAAKQAPKNKRNIKKK